MGNVANSTGRSIPEIKDSTREDMNLKGESLVEDKPDGDPRGGLGASTKAIERPLKREEIENGNSTKGTERTASMTATTRKASKTSTPINATFPESHRSRPSRTTEPSAKRSHKKGAGAAAQQLIAAATADDEGSSMQGDDEDDEDESEPRYCYCNQVSYGEMVACDMDNCPREWFHLDCVGLAKAPTKNGQFQLY